MQHAEIFLSYLDLPEFRGLYSKSGLFRFYVHGLKCSRCVQNIESLKSQVIHLKRIEVNLSQSTLEIEMNSPEDSLKDVLSAIKKKGFELRPIKSMDERVQLQAKEDRDDLSRLLVGGFCAGNIMMFALAKYSGADSRFFYLFDFLSLALYVPVVTYVSLPFFIGSLRDLRQKTLSIDLPMTVASLTGFILSAMNIFRGDPSVYLDSISGFLFLILLSRYFQKKLQRKFLNFQNSLYPEALNRVRLCQNEVEVITPIENLKVSDRITIRQGEIIPADGVLESRLAHIDLSRITGETHPFFAVKDSTILAGSQLMEGVIKIRVTQVGTDTVFGKIIESTQSQSLSKTRLQGIADKYSQILIGVVFCLALGALLFAQMQWIPISTEESLQRVLALLILACPCAMAFGTPLAQNFALKMAYKSGFLIKSADVFEKISRVSQVFFDKTGTLTNFKMKAQLNRGHVLDLDASRQILALERGSYHPVAQALCSEVLSQFPEASPWPMKNTFENLGSGILGSDEHSTYEIRKSSQNNNEVSFFRDEKNVLSFVVSSEPNSSAKRLLDWFKSKNIPITILSGDKQGQVDQAVSEISFHGPAYGNLLPQDKLKFILENTSPGNMTIMIGDGANDSLALKAASVGIAVKGSVDLALQNCDVYLLKEDLWKIQNLFLISKMACGIIKQNLLISLSYNTLAGGAALAGYMNPLLAAILMPLSSGFILLSSWLGSRSLERRVME